MHGQVNEGNKSNQKNQTIPQKRNGVEERQVMKETGGMVEFGQSNTGREREVKAKRNLNREAGEKSSYIK